MESSRVTIYDGPKFEIQLEYGADIVSLHITRIESFTKEVLLKMQEELPKIVKFLRHVGPTRFYVAVEEDNRQIQRLVTKFNFAYIGENEGLRIYEYQ